MSIKTTMLIVLVLAGIQLFEAVWPGLISGVINLSWIWLGAIILWLTSAKPEGPVDR